MVFVTQTNYTDRICKLMRLLLLSHFGVITVIIILLLFFYLFTFYHNTPLLPASVFHYLIRLNFDKYQLMLCLQLNHHMILSDVQSGQIIPLFSRSLVIRLFVRFYRFYEWWMKFASASAFFGDRWFCCTHIDRGGIGVMPLITTAFCI